MLLSGFIHLAAGTLLGWLIWQRTVQLARQAGEPQVVVTTAITIERRSTPQRVAPRRPTPRQETKPQRIAIKPRSIVMVMNRTTTTRATPSQPRIVMAVRKSMMHPVARAPAVVMVMDRATTRPAMGRSSNPDFTQDENLFAKAIAQARAKDDPVAGAARSVTPARAQMKRFTIEFGGSNGGQNEPDGYLDPVRSWRDGGYDYYYLRYTVTYADGSAEEGIVPWPVRYLPQVDPFLRGWHRMPLPGPPANFVLAAGTELHPLVAFCYEHRFALCPIEHG